MDALLLHFQSTWTGAGFNSPDDERAGFQAGQAMLQQYLAEAPPPEEMPRTLLQEKMLRMDRGHYVLTGRIDRLDEWPDGSLDIVDYKSGRSGVTEEQVRSDVGLMAYETLIRALYPDRVVRIAIHALRPNLRATVARTPEEAAGAAEILDDVARAIAAETLWTGVNVEERCVGCDFETYCPDWRH